MNSFCVAQNLVTNCSFEQHDTCPDNEAQIQRATGWFKTYGDADYYNSCSSGPWSVPPQINYQLPSSGDAFAGAIFFSEQVGAVEIIQTQLSSPLAVGTTYYVSFRVSLCLNGTAFMNQAIDKIGAKFTTGPPPLINNSAQVYSSTVITDTANWTTVSGSFVADSAYTHLFLGVFFDTAHVTSLMLTPSLIDRAYYFIDDVCVSDNASETCALTGIEETSSEKDILFFPNPASGEFTIYPEYSGRFTISNIVIYNVFGEKIFEKRLTSGVRHPTINVSSFSPGIYFVTVTDEMKNRITKRLVKM